MVRHVGTYPVFPYPHPETITLPKFIPWLKRATNLGATRNLDLVALHSVGYCT